MMREILTKGVKKSLPLSLSTIASAALFLIYTANDRIDVYFSTVDQRIKLIYLARLFHVWVIRNRS